MEQKIMYTTLCFLLVQHEPVEENSDAVTGLFEHVVMAA